MHRLRTKKKGRGDDDESTPPVPSVSRGFFKNKAPPLEPPQVELEFSLPASDDFRTSLLMPNLANRFSILKQEQAALAANGGHFLDGEDHATPARYIGLGDIAETSSITGSLLSAHDKLTSRSEERRASDEGESVMSRPRGGEGNVLFGGRQKVYRIAPKTLRGGTSSMEDLSVVGSMGKAISSSDVPESTFSRRNTKERDREEEADNKGDDLSEFNKNRYTSSSTNSTPTTMTRTSTAATSIHSQVGQSALITSPNILHNPNVVQNKTRRPLYEQALDQQLQDQQSSALGRLERLASLRRIGSQSPTRSDSPVFSGSPQLSHTSPTTSPTSRPTVPWSAKKSPEIGSLAPTEEVETPQVAAKPARPAGFDTFDFGINVQTSPSSSNDSKPMGFATQGPFRPGALNGDRTQRRSPVARDRVASPVSDRRSSVSLGAVGERSLSPANSGVHDDSMSTFLSQSNSSSARSSLMDPDQADQVIQHIGDELDEVTRDISSSDSHSPPISAMKLRFPSHPPEPEPVSRPDSPASRVSSDDDDPSRQFLDALRPLKNPEISPTSPRFTIDTPTTEDDSPTLPQGLSLLVRQHLRSDSGTSSMYAGSNYRMSRTSCHGVTQSAVKPSIGLRASGSSAGNMWQYDEFGHQNHDDEPPSPSSGCPPRSPGIPHQFVSPPEPEGEEITYPEPHSAIVGRYSEDNERRAGLERKYGRREEPEGREKRRVEERRDERRMEETERRGRRRAESKASGQDENSRGGSQTGTERSLSGAGDGDNQDRDWAERLAFRRQLVQQNLRNQEKIQSHHEGDNRDLPGGRIGTLKAKGSNGFLRNDNGRPPIIMGPNGPMRADGGGRGSHGGRGDGERPVIRGPHVGPPGPPFSGQPRPQQRQRQRPPLVTNNTFGSSGDHLGPDGRLRKSPSVGAHLRPRPSHEQMGGSASAGNTPRGQPMGWQDNWDPVPNSRSQPTSPQPRGPPGRPFQQPGDRYRDDLSKAMMTGQSAVAEPSTRPPRRRTGSSPERPIENVKSTFEDDRRLSNFRRPRGNSLIGKRIGDVPLPPINTRALSPPRNHSPGSKSAGAVPSQGNPSPAIIKQQIESANAVLAAPAKKKAVDKLQIGNPTLVYATSSFNTYDLPDRSNEPLRTPPSTASSNKSRKRTNTLFGAFGRSESNEQIPGVPSLSRVDTEFDSRSRKSSGSNRLRKSTSDGGTLGSRARVSETALMREQMPRIQHGALAGGMI